MNRQVFWLIMFGAIACSFVLGPVVALRWGVPWMILGLDYLQRALGPQPVLGWFIVGAALVVAWGSFAMALRFVHRQARRVPHNVRPRGGTPPRLGGRSLPCVRRLGKVGGEGIQSPASA